MSNEEEQFINDLINEFSIENETHFRDFLFHFKVSTDSNFDKLFKIDTLNKAQEQIRIAKEKVENAFSIIENSDLNQMRLGDHYPDISEDLERYALELLNLQERLKKFHNSNPPEQKNIVLKTLVDRLHQYWTVELGREYSYDRYDGEATTVSANFIEKILRYYCKTSIRAEYLNEKGLVTIMRDLRNQ